MDSMNLLNSIKELLKFHKLRILKEFEKYFITHVTKKIFHICEVL